MFSAVGRQAVAVALAKRTPANVITALRNITTTSVKNSGAPWIYRRRNQIADKATVFQVTAITSGMWYWIFYHVLSEPEHLYGHWIPPSPATWSDADLGVPGVGDENPDAADMRTRKERPRFLPTMLIDFYHEKFGGDRILDKRRLYGKGAEEEAEEEAEED